MIYLVVIQLLLTGHCIHSPIVFAEHEAVASETPDKVFFIRFIQVAVDTPRRWLVGIVINVCSYLACIGLQCIVAMSLTYSDTKQDAMTYALCEFWLKVVFCDQDTCSGKRPWALSDTPFKACALVTMQAKRRM